MAVMKHNLLHKPPTSVYRLQLCEEFPLKKATELLPYLHALGIDAIYCSPYYDAVSPHGYDVIDPTHLNPAIATQEEYDEFCSQLKKFNMKQILDVVPNHMGIQGRNQWWQDLLEFGSSSPYSEYFDIDWHPEKRALQEKVLLPVLGESYGVTLNKKEIALCYRDSGLFVSYHSLLFPLSPHSYLLFYQVNSSTPLPPPVQKALESLPLDSRDAFIKWKETLEEAIRNDKTVKEYTDRRMQELNSDSDSLHQVLETQYYRLTYWKVAAQEINYRRFFNINHLAAIRIENTEVFQTCHSWIFQLIEEEKVHGLRIDHPDGLYDPKGYFAQLRSHAPVYTIAEKILERSEKLPDDWEVEGTVGYDYLNFSNGLFIHPCGEEALTKLYAEFLGEKLNYKEILYRSKKLFARHLMASEVNTLGFYLDCISERDRDYRDFTREDLTAALREVIACFPVYRTYINPDSQLVSKADRKYIEQAIQHARERASHIDSSVFRFLHDILLLKLDESIRSRVEYCNFIRRFQQLTAPITAKGLEDTALYRYNRLLSLNEVGGSPIHFSTSKEEFHRFNYSKREKAPYGFLASSTHDSKRSEDVRMRINLLSEMTEIWQQLVTHWNQNNERLKKQSKEHLLPDLNTEYYLYQTLVGFWPDRELSPDEREEVKKRVWEALLKSIREANMYTSWPQPNERYEKATQEFFYKVIENEEFLSTFTPFIQKIARYGQWGSLSLTALKIASCGVVDLYQGCEMWKLTLMDPDNRRTPDYSHYLSSFKEISDHPNIEKLFLNSSNGKIKHFLYYTALAFRRDNPDLFLEGEYLPIEVDGEKKEHIIAFLRKTENQQLLVVATRFYATLLQQRHKLPLGIEVFGDTTLTVPAGVTWKDLFTKQEFSADDNKLSIASIFSTLPFAYLISEEK